MEKKIRFWMILFILSMDMMNTDTSIYLDEFLKNTKVSHLTIDNGGFITVKNRESINNDKLHHLAFNYINKIEGELLRGLNDLNVVIFRLDEQFEGYEALAEICCRSDCENIIVEYDNDDSGPLLQVFLQEKMRVMVNFSSVLFFCGILTAENMKEMRQRRLNFLLFQVD